MAPPSELGESGRKLWANIHRDFVVDDASGLEMLFQICSAADRVAEYAATIARDGGPTIRTKTGIREHPLLRHELAAQSFVVRSLHRLGFDVVSPRTELGRVVALTEVKISEHDHQAATELQAAARAVSEARAVNR